MWTPIVGQSFTPQGFVAYCHSLVWGIWRPSFVVLHNTGVPSLAQRPNGLTHQHIDALVEYYKNPGPHNKKAWSAGPHLFVDDRQIWVFTPLTAKGVHSPSWNSISWGVEMLGDYEKESFSSGRGLAVRRNTVSALATLHGLIGLDPHTLRLHKEDPETDHDCPGKNVSKADMIAAVMAEMARAHAGEHMPG